MTSLFAVSSFAKPTDISGKAVHIDDGDTLILLVNESQEVIIRLASIDAPEASHTKKETGRIGQPYSDQSRNHLAQLVKGKVIDAHCFETDRYGREVCELFAEGRSVNKEMVAKGLAWANLSGRGKYLRDKSLIEIEAVARSNRLGLWTGQNPVAPWEWRDRCWKQGQCRQ